MNQILIHEKIIVTPEFRKKKKIYKFNFFLSVFLACTLFSCYIYAEYDRNKSEQVSQEILSEIQESDETADTTTISVEEDVLIVKMLANPGKENNEVKVSAILKEAENPTSTIVESTAADGTKYYTESVLKIPKLKIEYPVLSETTDELLKISLNKLWGPKPNEVGNYVVVGHNYKSGKMFGKLSGIAIGDEVKIEDLTGRTITYEVYDRYTVEPSDVSCTSQMTEGRKEITLITCQNSGKLRLIVKAREVLDN